MNIYEKLQEQACKEGIDIVDYNFQSDRIKGLYCDGMVMIQLYLDDKTFYVIFTSVTGTYSCNLTT